jgi:hypothetical protein
MPGFKLAKKVYEIFQQNPKVQGRIKKKQIGVSHFQLVRLYVRIFLQILIK